MRPFCAFILLLIGIAMICFPLYVVWLGLASDLTTNGRIIVIIIGLFLCWLVKPISILTGKDYKIF